MIELARIVARLRLPSGRRRTRVICVLEQGVLHSMKQPAGPDIGLSAKNLRRLQPVSMRFPYSYTRQLYFVLLVSPPHWSVPRAINYFAIETSSCNRLPAVHAIFESPLRSRLLVGAPASIYPLQTVSSPSPHRSNNPAMSAIDPSSPAETIAQRVKQRKPLMSTTVIANMFFGN